MDAAVSVAIIGVAAYAVYKVVQSAQDLGVFTFKVAIFFTCLTIAVICILQYGYAPIVAARSPAPPPPLATAEPALPVRLVDAVSKTVQTWSQYAISAVVGREAPSLPPGPASGSKEL